MIESRHAKRGQVLLAAVFVVSLSQQCATASPADWSQGFLLQTSGGFVNPVLLVGFNPQPEPPAYSGETLFSIVDGEAEITVTDVSNPVGGGLQNFQFLFAVASNTGMPATIYPPDPIDDLRIGFSLDAGGVPLEFTAIVDVQSTSGGIMSPDSAVAFNPQPEPPALGFDGFETWGLDFGVTSLSDVTLTLRIEDAMGERLPLTRIPEPGSISLCVLAALGVLAGRRRSRHGSHKRGHVA